MPEELWRDPTKISSSGTEKIDSGSGGRLVIQSMNSIARSLKHPVFCHVMAHAYLNRTLCVRLQPYDWWKKIWRREPASGDFMLIRCSISSQDGIKGLFDKVHSKVWNNQKRALSLVSPVNGVSGGRGGKDRIPEFPLQETVSSAEAFLDETDR